MKSIQQRMKEDIIRCERIIERLERDDPARKVLIAKSEVLRAELKKMKVHRPVA